MAVTILFFGQTAQVVGQRKVEQSVEAGAAIKDVVNSLLSKYPELNGITRLYALNQKYVPEEETVSDGDELAIFTPVSGG